MLFFWSRQPVTTVARVRAGPWFAWFATAVILWRCRKRIARIIHRISFPFQRRRPIKSHYHHRQQYNHPHHHHHHPEHHHMSDQLQVTEPFEQQQQYHKLHHRHHMRPKPATVPITAQAVAGSQSTGLDSGDFQRNNQWLLVSTPNLATFSFSVQSYLYIHI